LAIAGQLLGTAVVAVVQRLGEHVRPGERELERPGRERPGARAGDRQVERAGADRAFDHAGRTRAEAHARGLGVVEPLGETDLGADARHRPHEVFDHAVGFGVIEVEAIQLAVADDVDPGLLLCRDHHARRVDQRLLRGRGGEPVGNRIGADHRGEYAGRSHAEHLLAGIIIGAFVNSPKG